MPNTKSASKRLRSDQQKRLHNRMAKSRLKTVEKRLDAAIATGDRGQAEQALRAAASLFDKAAKQGTIHPNKADRKKARLSARVRRVTA